MDDLVKIVEKECWDRLKKEEGITKEDLEVIDLDIAYSPVVPIKGESPCNVTKTIGGKYLVRHFLCPEAISEDALKVMRYRFLTSDCL